MKSDLRINISNLSEGIHQYNFQTDAENIGLDNRFSNLIAVKAEIDKSTNQFLLKVELNSSGSFECDRCLNKFEKQLRNSYELLYQYKSRLATDDNSEDVRLINPDTNYIDLADEVRDYMVLSVPIKLICSEECKGLCTSCGTNLNDQNCDCKNEITDERWEALSDLIKKENNKNK